MDRRGFLKLLGIGAGAAVVAVALPDILTPDDEAWEPVRRYWQGWAAPRSTVGGFFPDFGERHDTWIVELQIEPLKQHLRDHITGGILMVSRAGKTITQDYARDFDLSHLPDWAAPSVGSLDRLS